MHDLIVNDRWVIYTKPIKHETWLFFMDNFQETMRVRPTLINSNFKKKLLDDD